MIAASTQHARAVEADMDEEALSSLAALLWNERSQLERLLYSLVSQQLIIASGQSRWLGHADTNVQTAMTAFRDADLLRAVDSEALIAKLGVSADISLGELAATMPEPWAQTLGDHRTALRALAAEIDATVAENQRLLQAGSQAIGETLSRLGSFSSTYDAAGGSVRYGDGPTFLDEQA